MTILTDRAAVEEKAAAWDHLMSSTESDSVAITKVFCWLRDHVTAREAAPRVAGNTALAAETENVVALTGLQVDDREFGCVP